MKGLQEENKVQNKLKWLNASHIANLNRGESCFIPCSCLFLFVPVCSCHLLSLHGHFRTFHLDQQPRMRLLHNRNKATNPQSKPRYGPTPLSLANRRVSSPQVTRCPVPVASQTQTSGTSRDAGLATAKLVEMALDAPFESVAHQTFGHGIRNRWSICVICMPTAQPNVRATCSMGPRHVAPSGVSLADDNLSDARVPLIPSPWLRLSPSPRNHILVSAPGKKPAATCSHRHVLILKTLKTTCNLACGRLRPSSWVLAHCLRNGCSAFPLARPSR